MPVRREAGTKKNRAPVVLPHLVGPTFGTDKGERRAAARGSTATKVYGYGTSSVPSTPGATASTSAAAAGASPAQIAAQRAAERRQERVIKKYVYNREKNRAVAQAAEKQDGEWVLTKTPREIGQTVREAADRIGNKTRKLQSDPRVVDANQKGQVIRKSGIRRLDRIRSYEESIPGADMRKGEQEQITGPFLGESRVYRKVARERSHTAEAQGVTTPYAEATPYTKKERELSESMPGYTKYKPGIEGAIPGLEEAIERSPKMPSDLEFAMMLMSAPLPGVGPAISGIGRAAKAVRIANAEKGVQEALTISALRTPAQAARTVFQAGNPARQTAAAIRSGVGRDLGGRVGAAAGRVAGSGVPGRAAVGTARWARRHPYLGVAATGIAQGAATHPGDVPDAIGDLAKLAGNLPEANVPEALRDVARVGKTIPPLLAHTIFNTATDPAVRKAALDSFPQLALETIEFPWLVAQKSATEGPGDAISEMAGGLAEGIEERWNPAIQGDWETVKEQQADPMLGGPLITFAEAAGLGSIASKGALAGFKRIPGVPRERIENRPNLAATWGPLGTRAQRTSKGALGRVTQALIDVARDKRQARRERKFEEGGKQPKVFPGEGEVAYFFDKRTGRVRAANRAAARVKGQNQLVSDAFTKDVVTPLHRKYADKMPENAWETAVYMGRFGARSAPEAIARMTENLERLKVEFETNRRTAQQEYLTERVKLNRMDREANPEAWSKQQKAVQDAAYKHKIAQEIPAELPRMQELIAYTKKKGVTKRQVAAANEILRVSDLSAERSHFIDTTEVGKGGLTRGEINPLAEAVELAQKSGREAPGRARPEEVEQARRVAVDLRERADALQTKINESEAAPASVALEWKKQKVVGERTTAYETPDGRFRIEGTGGQTRNFEPLGYGGKSWFIYDTVTGKRTSAGSFEKAKAAAERIAGRPQLQGGGTALYKGEPWKVLQIDEAAGLAKIRRPGMADGALTTVEIGELTPLGYKQAQQAIVDWQAGGSRQEALAELRTRQAEAEARVGELSQAPEMLPELAEALGPTRAAQTRREFLAARRGEREAKRVLAKAPRQAERVTKPEIDYAKQTHRKYEREARKAEREVTKAEQAELRSYEAAGRKAADKASQAELKAASNELKAVASSERTARAKVEAEQRRLVKAQQVKGPETGFVEPGKLTEPQARRLSEVRSKGTVQVTNHIDGKVYEKLRDKGLVTIAKHRGFPYEVKAVSERGKSKTLIKAEQRLKDAENLATTEKIRLKVKETQMTAARQNVKQRRRLAEVEARAKAKAEPTASLNAKRITAADARAKARTAEGFVRQAERHAADQRVKIQKGAQKGLSRASQRAREARGRHKATVRSEREARGQKAVYERTWSADRNAYLREVGKERIEEVLQSEARPAYLPDTMHRETFLSHMHTRGLQGGDAPRFSSGELARTGRRSHTREDLIGAIRSNERANVRLETIERIGYGLGWDVRELLGLHGEKAPSGRLTHEMIDTILSEVIALEKQGYALINVGKMTGRLREVYRESRAKSKEEELTAQEFDGLTAHEIQEAGKNHYNDLEKVLVEAADNPEFVADLEGWRIVEANVLDQIAGRPPETTGGKIWDNLNTRTKSLASRTLLGLNPQWLSFQVYANMALLGIGRPGAFFGGPQFLSMMKKLDPATKELYERSLGVSPHAEVYAESGKQTVASLMAQKVGLEHTGIYRRTEGRSILNPLFRLDYRQNHTSKGMFLGNLVSKEAFKRMDGRMSRLAVLQDQILSKVLGGKRYDPKRLDEYGEKIKEVLRDPILRERLARETNDWMGDYLSFTAEERRVLSNNVMFYGFLRHSLTLAFNTLPRSPVRLALLTKMGEAALEEKRDILRSMYRRGAWAFINAQPGAQNMPEGYLKDALGEIMTEYVDPQLEVLPIPTLGDFYFKGPVELPILGQVLGEGFHRIGTSRAAALGNLLLEGEVYRSGNAWRLLNLFNPFFTSMGEALISRDFYTGQPLKTGEKNQDILGIHSLSALEWGKHLAEEYTSLIPPLRGLLKGFSSYPVSKRQQGAIPGLINEIPVDYSKPSAEAQAARVSTSRYQRRLGTPLEEMMKVVVPFGAAGMDPYGSFISFLAAKGGDTNDIESIGSDLRDYIENPFENPGGGLLGKDDSDIVEGIDWSKPASKIRPDQVKKALSGADTSVSEVNAPEDKPGGLGLRSVFNPDYQKGREKADELKVGWSFDGFWPSDKPTAQTASKQTKQRVKNKLEKELAKSSPTIEGPLAPGQRVFGEQLAKETGLDPGVIGAWMLAENSDANAMAKDQEGYHNWLNIGPFTEDARFGDPVTAARATASFLAGDDDSPAGGFAAPDSILPAAGLSPEQQMQAIEASPWSATGYGAGATLDGTYALVKGSPGKPPDKSLIRRAENILGTKQTKRIVQSRGRGITPQGKVFDIQPIGDGNQAVPVKGNTAEHGYEDRAMVNPAIAKDVAKKLKRFDVSIGYAYDPEGGHQSPGHNEYGTALDVHPAESKGGDWDDVNRFVKWGVEHGLTVYYDGQFGSTPLDGHGEGNHAHFEWDDYGGHKFDIQALAGSSGVTSSGTASYAPSSGVAAEAPVSSPSQMIRNLPRGQQQAARLKQRNPMALLNLIRGEGRGLDQLLGIPGMPAEEAEAEGEPAAPLELAMQLRDELLLKRR